MHEQVKSGRIPDLNTAFVQMILYIISIVMLEALTYISL